MDVWSALEQMEGRLTEKMLCPWCQEVGDDRHDEGVARQIEASPYEAVLAGDVSLGEGCALWESHCELPFRVVERSEETVS